MIDVQKLMQEAASGLPASLLDDPTVWGDGQPTSLDVQSTLNDTLRENARSAVRLAVGKKLDKIAELLDGELTAAGDFADLESVFAQHVNGLDVDFSAFKLPGKWEDRINGLRAAVAASIDALATPTVGPDLYSSYVAQDERLAHLRTGKPFKVPGFLTASGQDLYDFDEPATEPGPEPELDFDAVDFDVVEAGEPVVRVTPGLLCELMANVSINDQDVAEALGISKSSYSMIRNGKRPWKGLKPAQAKSLHELLLRRRTIAEQALATLAALTEDSGK